MNTKEFLGVIEETIKKLQEQEEEDEKIVYLPGPLAHIITDALEKQGYKVTDEGGGCYSYC